MTENVGTETETDEATEDETPPTTPGLDEVTKLARRAAGLDAKVTSLLETSAAAIARAEAAEARAIELAQGKDNGDAELRALLAAKEAELEAARTQTLEATVASKFPETYAVLGKDALNLPPEKLAEAEARFAGAGEATSPPTIGNNGSRGTSTAPPQTAQERLAALEAAFRRAEPPEDGTSYHGTPRD